ncbi:MULTISPECIES: hypothetical protein [Streptomyces]
METYDPEGTPLDTFEDKEDAEDFLRRYALTITRLGQAKAFGVRLHPVSTSTGPAWRVSLVRRE